MSNSLADRMWLVMTLHRNVELDFFGHTRNVPLSYAEGMIGGIPVFETKEAADKFAEGRYRVIEIEVAP